MVKRSRPHSNSNRKTNTTTTAGRIDVRSPSDVPKFEEMLSKGPMAVVLVYADWCGHCVNFKQNVWNDKTLSKPRSMNAAAVREDMVANTSMKNANIEGYPTVFLVGKDKKAVNIKTPGSSEELVEMMNKTPEANINEGIENNDKNAVMNMENSNETMNTNTAMPPNVTSDTMSNTSEQRGGGVIPDGLYDMLLKGAPAALLTGAALAMRGGRTRRSSRRSLRKKSYRKRR